MKGSSALLGAIFRDADGEVRCVSIVCDVKRVPEDNGIDAEECALGNTRTCPGDFYGQISLHDEERR